MKYMETPMGALILDADDDGITRGEFVVDSLPLQGVRAPEKQSSGLFLARTGRQAPGTVAASLDADG